MDNLETHKLLPSGEWEGFYCYLGEAEQHKMSTELTFSNGKIEGIGMDDIAPFSWHGVYKLETLKLKMTKSYATHQIIYAGDIDENGIWGMWDSVTDYSKYGFSMEMIVHLKEAIKDKIRGGFHIWPKKNKQNSVQDEAEDKVSESLKLKELFLEKLNL